MTIFRSRWTDIAAKSFAVIGMLGFFACWSVGRNAEVQILGHEELMRPDKTRPVAIELKGQTFYVRKEYGRRVLLADRLMFVFFGLGFAGIALANRTQLTGLWKNRKS